MNGARIELARPGWSMRRWRDGDQAALQRSADDERIARWMSDTWPSPYTRADADAWIHRHALETGSNWALCHEDDPCGGIGAHPQAGFLRCNVEVGWWLAPAHWGQGIVALAARELLQRVFADADVTRVFAPIHAGNHRSMRLAQKIGMTLESVQPRSAYKRGVVIDRHLYALYR